MSRWLTIKTLPMDYEKTDKAGTWIGWGKWRRESKYFKCTDVMWLATLARKNIWYNNAARVIQKAFGLYLLLRNSNPMILLKEERNSAAVCIQKYARGYIVRKKSIKTSSFYGAKLLKYKYQAQELINCARIEGIIGVSVGDHFNEYMGETGSIAMSDFILEIITKRKKIWKGAQKANKKLGGRGFYDSWSWERNNGLYSDSDVRYCKQIYKRAKKIGQNLHHVAARIIVRAIRVLLQNKSAGKITNGWRRERAHIMRRERMLKQKKTNSLVKPKKNCGWYSSSISLYPDYDYADEMLQNEKKSVECNFNKHFEWESEYLDWVISNHDNEQEKIDRYIDNVTDDFEN